MLAWHCAMQVVMSLLDVHCPEQDAIASASHEPWQSNPPLALQLPMQLPVQLAVQPASIPPLHPPMQLASSEAEQEAEKLMGVQFAVHPPDVWSVHIAVEFRSRLPHAGRKSARAVPAVRVTMAPKTTGATAKSRRRSVILFLRGLDVPRTRLSQRSSH
jgi:hypothetical protein